MNRKVALKDIARKVGVSTTLVSYVMSGKEKQARVGSEMAKKIKETARKLQYQPNHIAQSLKSGKSNTIGLIVADISNPFFAHIARIVEDEAKKYGYTVIFGSSDEQVVKSGDLIEALLKRQVDGLIIAPAEGTEAQVKKLMKGGVPFVLIDRYFPALTAKRVAIDNFNAAYMAVEHLVQSGYKRIAMLTYASGLHHMQEREKGYRQALTDHGIKPRKQYVLKATYNNLKEDVKDLLGGLLFPLKIDALLFATNSLAVEGLRVVNKAGIEVPDKLGIVSFDESEVLDFFYSPVTYIRQSLTDMGDLAVSMLVNEINGKPGNSLHGDAGYELVLRESSLPQAVV